MGTECMGGFRLWVFERGIDGVAMSDGFLFDCFVFLRGGEWYVAHCDIQLLLMNMEGYCCMMLVKL